MSRAELSCGSELEILGNKLHRFEAPNARAIGLFYGEPPAIEPALLAMQICLQTTGAATNRCSGAEYIRKLFQEALETGHANALETGVVLSGILYAISGANNTWLHIQGVGEPETEFAIHDTVVNRSRSLEYGHVPALGTEYNKHQVLPSSVKIHPEDNFAIHIADQTL